MIYCYYLVISLSLIIIQTTLIHYFPLFGNFYDLLIPFVVYLGLFCPVREGFPVVIVLGLVMDSLSGSPFGLYVTAYFWLFVCMIWIIRFLNIRSSFLLPFVIAPAILFENVIFVAGVSLLIPDSKVPNTILDTTLIQILWAIFTGPFLILIFNAAHKGWSLWLTEHFTRQNGHNV